MAPDDDANRCDVGRTFRPDTVPANMVPYLGDVDWVTPCPNRGDFILPTWKLCAAHATPIFAMVERELGR
jgi:hypothetical protein